MYEQQNTFVSRKYRANYKERGNWGTTKTRNIHIFTLSVQGIDFRHQNLMSRRQETEKSIPALKG